MYKQSYLMQMTQKQENNKKMFCDKSYNHLKGKSGGTALNKKWITHFTVWLTQVSLTWLTPKHIHSSGSSSWKSATWKKDTGW